MNPPSRDIIRYSSLASKLDLDDSSRPIAEGLDGFSLSVLTVKGAMRNGCSFIQTLGVFNWVLQIFQSIVLIELQFLLLHQEHWQHSSPAQFLCQS